MLIEFRVKNYCCLRDEQVLSLVPSSDTSLLESNTYETGVPSVPRLLRTAVIYGPNAGGKSTVLRAFQTMLSMVIFSADLKKEHLLLPFPFLLDNTSREEPTAFELSFLYDGRRYQYGFSCEFGRILEEYLLEYSSARPTTLFQRSYDSKSNKDVYTFSRSLRGPKNIWRDATQHDVLFLSRAAQLNSEQLYPIWKHNFSTSLIFNNKLRPPLNVFLKQILKYDELKNEICKFLTAADISIKEIDIKKISQPENSSKRFSNKNIHSIENSPEEESREQYLLLFIHDTKQGDITLPAGMESEGTMHLFYYLSPLLTVLRLGTVIAIDELDASLHPLLVRRVVEMFQSPKTNPKGAQLIFTTHDTSLLQAVGTLFRRDQVWFVEKNTDQASELYSLAEFKRSKGESVERNYFQGRYGGLPLLRDWEEVDGHGA